MFIKKLIKYTSIVLCLCCLPIMQSANALDYIYDRYLAHTFLPDDEIPAGGSERALLEKVILNTPDDEKIPCIIRFKDLDIRSIKQETEKYLWDNYDGWQYDETNTLYNQYYAQFFEENKKLHHEDISSKFGLSVEDIVTTDRGKSYCILDLTKDEIEKYKAEPSILGIYYYMEEGETLDLPKYNEKLDGGIEAFLLDWKIPDDKRIPTAIQYKDPYSSAHDEEYTQELNDRVAQFDRSDYTSDEWRSLVSCLETRVRREIAMKCNADMAETFDLPKENIVKTDFGRNLIWAYLNKDEIRKLLDNEYITNINYEEMIEPQSWNDDTCISRELLQRFDGSDKKYNVVITVGFRSSKEYYRDQFFEWMRWTQEKSEKFADTYLADKDTRCIGKVIYVELTEKEIRGLDWVHQVIGTISDIDLAENLSMNDVPVYEEYFEDIEYLYEASDSMKIQRMVVGLDKYEYSERYDVDSDGKLSNRDAMYILRSTISLENISPEFRYKHKIMNFYKDLGIQTYDDSYYPTA